MSQFRYTFAIVLMLSSVDAAAQTQVKSVAAEEFLSGGWVTDPDNRTAAISTGLPATVPDTAIRVASAFMSDQADISHTITTDRGTVTISAIPESSGAVIEGRNIELRQGAPNGRLVGGIWTAVKQPVAPGGFTSFSWSIFPGQSAQLLDLATPRQFVVTFLGHTSASCNNGRIRVNVDGQWLKYRSGTVLQLPPSASIWAYGKSVFTMWDGTCTVPTGAPAGSSPMASGTIKIAL